MGAQIALPTANYFGTSGLNVLLHEQAYKIRLYIKLVLEHHATRSVILFAEKLKKDKNNYSLRYIIRFITSMGCYSNFSNTHFGNYYASTGWFGNSYL